MKPIVILEMANNHMGSLLHAKRIIKQFSKVTKKYQNKIDFVIKFQFRDEKTFIHTDFQNSENKFVKRFEDTFLSNKDWIKLISYAKQYYKVACTPFDENSIEKIYKLKIDFLKVASVSSTDWNLIESIYKKYKKEKKKIFVSLGGLSEIDIIKVISFFKNRKIDASFLYCVAKYPTNKESLNLSYFNHLRNKFGNSILGFSTHEDPSIKSSQILAFGSGVRIFEKHIGYPTKKISLNKYSVTPENLDSWLAGLKDAINMWGSVNNRNKSINDEQNDLNNFRRGIYLKNNISKQKKVNTKDIYFAFPCSSNQLSANEWTNTAEIIVKKKIGKNDPLNKKDIKIKNN